MSDTSDGLPLHGEELALVAHDIRAPLHSIIAASGLLNSGQHDDPDGLHDLIANAAARLEGLIDDLLTAARPDQLEIPIRREAIDVNALLSRTAADAASRYSVEPSVRCPAGAELWADRRSLDRIIHNLVENAARHGAPPIDVSFTSHPGLAVIEVSNGGPPIDDETKKVLFTRFGVGSGPSARSGLGLHIVSRLVVAHGGSIRLVEPEGRTVFRVELPQRTEERVAR